MGIKKWTENSGKLATEYPGKIGPVTGLVLDGKMRTVMVSHDQAEMKQLQLLIQKFTFSLTKWPTTHLYISKKMYISIKPAVHLSTWLIYPLTYHHYFGI